MLFQSWQIGKVRPVPWENYLPKGMFHGQITIKQQIENHNEESNSKLALMTEIILGLAKSHGNTMSGPASPAKRRWCFGVFSTAESRVRPLLASKAVHTEHAAGNQGRED